MADTPELGRLVVLHGAILALLLDGGVDRADEGTASILKEADALTLRIAHRSRSAIAYDQTLRGKAALDDAQQVRDVLAALPADADPPLFVEIVEYTWDRDQVDNLVELATGTPNRKLVRRQFVGGMRFLSDPNTELGENRADNS